MGVPQLDSHYVPEAYAHASSRKQIGLRRFLTIAFRDRRKIALGFLIPMTIATIASFIPKKKYVAEAFLLVRPGREYVYRPEVGDGNAPPVTYDLDHSCNSEVEMLTSRPVEQKALEVVGYEKLYPEIAAGKDDDLSRPEQALVELRNKVDALVIKDSTVIDFTFKHRDRFLAAAVVNAMIDEYLKARREIMSDPRTRFEQAEVDAARRKLDELEEKIRQYKHQNNIVDFDEQRALLLEQHGDLDQKLKQTALAVDTATGKMRALNRGLNRAKASVPLYADTTPDEAVNNAQKVLFDLRLQRQDAVDRYSENSSLAQQLDKQVEQAEAQLKQLETTRQSTVRTGRSPVRDALETNTEQLSAELSGDRTAKSVLQAQLATVNAQLQELNDREFEVKGMERERALLEDAYATYVKKLQEARISDQLDLEAKTNVSVIQRALPPIEKKNLMWIILAVGGLLSVASALFVAWLSEIVRETFVDPEEVEPALGVPVIASFPEAIPLLPGKPKKLKGVTTSDVAVRT